MGLYTALSFKSDHDTSDLEAHVLDSMSAKHTLPIAWTALFKPENINAEHFIAVTTTAQAKQTLQSRNENLIKAVGQEWEDGIASFIARLDAANYVELNMVEMYVEPELFEQTMAQQFAGFDEPFYTGTKHLFSRRPKITPFWLEGVIELVPSMGVFE